jgi:hypothetical protein
MSSTQRRKGVMSLMMLDDKGEGIDAHDDFITPVPLQPYLFKCNKK